MRMVRMLLIAIFLIAGFTASAQTISLSGTITDSSSQVWNSCSWSASIYSPAGAPMYGATPVPTNTFGGSCSSSGVLTSTGQFYNTSTITPRGALYTINVCSNTTAPCTTMLLPVTSSIQFFAAVNATLTLPSVAAFVGTIAYSDSEVVPTPLVGSRYWNSMLNQIRYWNGTSWQSDGGSNGGVSGPTSSTANDIAAFGNSNGTAIIDTGIQYIYVAQLGGFNSWTGNNTWNGLSTFNSSTSGSGSYPAALFHAPDGSGALGIFPNLASQNFNPYVQTDDAAFVCGPSQNSGQTCDFVPWSAGVGGFRMTPSGVLFAQRPTFAGNTPWDNGNFNPASYSPLSGSGGCGSGTVSVVPDAAAGTGSTASVVGNATRGTVTLFTGTGPINGVNWTLTGALPAGASTSPYATFSPANETASGFSYIYLTTTYSSGSYIMSLNVINPGDGLLANSTFAWTYHCDL
jgi:hypothetical protein